MSGKLVGYLWNLNASECHLRKLETHDWRILAKTLIDERFLEQKLRQTLQSLDQKWTISFYGGIETLSLRDTDQKMADPPIGLVNRCRIMGLCRISKG